MLRGVMRHSQEAHDKSIGTHDNLHTTPRYYSLSVFVP